MDLLTVKSDPLSPLKGSDAYFYIDSFPQDTRLFVMGIYSNPTSLLTKRCLQISLIDAEGTGMLNECQDMGTAQAVALPESKDPEVTARWIERCVTGSEPLPQSLRIQLACCLVAAGEAITLGQGLAKVAEHW